MYTFSHEGRVRDRRGKRAATVTLWTPRSQEYSHTFPRTVEPWFGGQAPPPPSEACSMTTFESAQDGPRGKMITAANSRAPCGVEPPDIDIYRRGNRPPCAWPPSRRWRRRTARGSHSVGPIGPKGSRSSCWMNAAARDRSMSSRALLSSETPRSEEPEKKGRYAGLRDGRQGCEKSTPAG